MAYVYTPYKMSNATKNARKTARTDEKTLRNYYENGYSQGAGGYKGQLNTAQQRLNTLYNNNNLSQQFNYSKQADYDRALNNLANREAFKYDINDDQLFQTAKEQYMQMGKAAMADTIGQASAMTGGYGNSYAATAGAQAYNAHIQQLNNSVGDYYSMALKAYENETNRLQGVFSAYQGDRAKVIGMYTILCIVHMLMTFIIFVPLTRTRGKREVMDLITLLVYPLTALIIILPRIIMFGILASSIRQHRHSRKKPQNRTPGSGIIKNVL